MFDTPRHTLKTRFLLIASITSLAMVLVGSSCGGPRLGDWKMGEALAIRVPEVILLGQIAYSSAEPVQDETLATASDTYATFGPTINSPVLESTEVVTVNGAIQIRNVDYTMDYETGMVTFTNPPLKGEVTIDYEKVAHFVIRPLQDGNELYLARVVIVNNRANFLSLAVASDTVQLLARNNLEWQALDPFGEARQEIESAPSDLDKYIPFVWGPFDLPHNYQMDGWVIFEVPAGTAPRVLRWDTGDTVLLNL